MSSVTDAIGLTDHKGAKKAAEASAKASAEASAEAAKATERSYGLTKEELDFQKEQYADWKAIYGPLQEDLGTYFKNLNGGTLSAPHIQAIQAESQKAQEQINQQLAQRGLSGGGLEAKLLNQNIFSAGMQKAAARASGETLATQKKLGFIGIGLGQGSAMLGNTAQVSSSGASSQSSISGSQAGLSGSQAGLSGSLGTASMNATGEVIGAGIAAGAQMFSDIRLKDDITLVNSVSGINFYTWLWNTAANAIGLSGSSFGVIAQEVQSIVPDSVISKGDYLAVDYSKILDYIKEN